MRSQIRQAVTPSIEDVFERDARRLWWSILAYAGDREIAHDAVAEAFAQALRRGDALRDPAAWVWRTAFVVARGELKGRGRSRPLEDESTTMAEPVGLFEALARLSPKQRAVIVLHHYAGYRLREIGPMLGITKGTAGVHLSRGRRRLREVLEERDG